MLTVEEKERLQKEEKLNKAGKKISLAAEELNTYRWEQILDTCKEFFICGMQLQQRKWPIWDEKEMWFRINQNRKFTFEVLSLFYRQRAKDLEEELDRTSQAYKNQVIYLKTS